MSTVKQLSLVTKAIFLIACILVAFLAYTIAKTSDSIATPAVKQIVTRSAQTNDVINNIR